MRLSDEELKAVLERAEEIQRASGHADMGAEIAVVLSAAEEVGISREAVQQALAERLPQRLGPPTRGSLVWARSADGQFYVAEVTDVAEHDARVRFLRGGEVRLPHEALRPATFLPGEKVKVNWPMWGPWECTVVRYDATYHHVEVSDGWGGVEGFTVRDVWRSAPQDASPAARRRRLAWALAASGTVGALIGTLLTAIILR